MFDVGGGELLLILIAVLLLFGPSKLPELARSFGKGMAQFRKAQTDLQRNINALSDEIQGSVHDITHDQTALTTYKRDLEPTLPSLQTTTDAEGESTEAIVLVSPADHSEQIVPYVQADEAIVSFVEAEFVSISHPPTIQIRPAEHTVARNGHHTASSAEVVPVTDTHPAFGDDVLRHPAVDLVDLKESRESNS
jgi:TatA/E family protein of Tat protein translocase